ncbi:hypothetical protein PT2222_100155 [Paraburkholderia tropica]
MACARLRSRVITHDDNDSLCRVLPVAGDLARAAVRARRLLALASGRAAAGRRARGGLAVGVRRGARAQRSRRDRRSRRLAAPAKLWRRLPRDRDRRSQHRRHRRSRARRRARAALPGKAHRHHREAAACGLVGEGLGAVAGHRSRAHARSGRRLPAAHRRRHRPSARRARATRGARAGREARPGFADGASALRLVLGKGADSRLRVFLRQALSVRVGQQSAQQDGGGGGRLHAGAPHGAGGSGRHRVDPRRTHRRLQPRGAHQASRRGASSDSSGRGGEERVAAPVRFVEGHLEHDRAHRVHAAALLGVAARGHAAGHGGDLSRAAGGRARAGRAGLARVARLGADVLRLRADACLLSPLAAVGAVPAARRAVLRGRDLRFGVALLARQGRPVEGARAGAGARALRFAGARALSRAPVKKPPRLHAAAFFMPMRFALRRCGAA